MDVAERLAACGVIPVVQLREPSLGPPLAETLRDAGLPCIEVTFREPRAEWAIAQIRERVPGVLVAAGTVLTVAQAAVALDAGAELIVAPGTNPRVVEYVLGRGAPMLPGVATPSEIEANLGRGITLMKLFPAEVVGGLAFLRAVAAPYASVRFVPTGGLSPGNLAAYLAQTNVAACGGSWIAPLSAVETRDWSEVGRVARESVEIVRRVRQTGSSG